MAEDTLTAGDQTSLSIGGGRPPSLLINFRTGNAKDHVEEVGEVGSMQIPVVRMLEAEWLASAPTPPAVTPAAMPQTTTYDQGVANVQAQMATQAPPPGSGLLPDGSLHPTKTCPICGAARKVVDRPKKSGGRYRKLECSVDYKHQPDWSENYK